MATTRTTAATTATTITTATTAKATTKPATIARTTTTEDDRNHLKSGKNTKKGKNKNNDGEDNGKGKEKERAVRDTVLSSATPMNVDREPGFTDLAATDGGRAKEDRGDAEKETKQTGEKEGQEKEKSKGETRENRQSRKEAARRAALRIGFSSPSTASSSSTTRKEVARRGVSPPGKRSEDTDSGSSESESSDSESSSDSQDLQSTSSESTGDTDETSDSSDNSDSSDSSDSSQEPVGDLDFGGLSWEWVCTAQVPTLKHIPKGSRREWGEVLNQQIRRVLERVTDERGWLLLFSLPKLCLRNPPRGGKSKRHRMRTVHVIAERLMKAKRGMWKELWKEADASAEKMRDREPRRQMARQGIKERVMSLVAEGQYSRACRALVSEGMSPFDENVARQLREKHPQRGDFGKLSDLVVEEDHGDKDAEEDEEEDSSTTEEEEERIEFSHRSVRKALQDFPKGSAAGGSGCRAQHWLDAAGELMKKMEMLANGEAPRSIAKWIAGAPVF